MRTFGFRRFFIFPFLLVAILFFGLFVSLNSIFAQGVGGPGGGGDGGGGGGGATGGDGFSPTYSTGPYIVGRFFNDVNGDGIRQNSEAFIYSDSTECPEYIGVQMRVPGVYVSVVDSLAIPSEVNYPLESCDVMSDDAILYNPAPGYSTGVLFYGDKPITAHLPSGWHCTTSSCPMQTVYVDAYDHGVAAAPIGIQQDSIDLAFSMIPPALVSAIGNKTLRADVLGSATGNINYTFWWNCSDSTNSVDVASVGSACGDPSNPIKGSVFDGVSETTKSVPHTYPPGDYTAKVIVERGGAIPVERRIDFTVTPPVPSQGYIIGRVFNDKDGDGTRDVGEPNIQNGGNLCSGSYPVEVVSGVEIKWINGQTHFSSVGPRECDSEGPYYNSGAVSVVPNNTYTVGVDIPSGWVRTTGDQTVTVPAGGLGVTSDDNHPWFGIRRESFISGVVFRDDNGNGWPDNGEQTLISKAGCPGYVDQIILPGAVVSGTGPTNFSTEPDKCLPVSEMPYYVSLDIKPGTYDLSLTAPAGWKSTTGSKTVAVVAGVNTTAIDDSWLWFGLQPLGIPQGDHQGASGTNVGSLNCNVEGWAGDPDYPAGDINVRVKKDGVIIAGPLLADQLVTEPPPTGPIANSWWVGNGCAVNDGDRVSCYFGKTSPISIYSSMSDGLTHLVLVEAEDVNSSGVPTGVWVPLAVGSELKSPKVLQCRPPGRVQIERINADGSFISGTLANVDVTVGETCAEITVCSDNPSLFSGVDPSGHGAHASELDEYNEKVGVCSYAVGSSPCTVSSFSDATCGTDDCNQAITVTEGEVTKVVYKYEPVLPDLITNHQPITINGALTTGSTLNFKSNVRNQGNGAAIAGSFGRWCMDDGTEAECAGEADPPSQLNLSTMFGVFDSNTNSGDRTSNSWSTATAGSHTVWWCADVKKIIIESNESNNCTSQSFNVSVAPNNAPVADAGSNHSTTKDVSHTHTGSVSDTDGNLASYDWDFDSCPGACPSNPVPVSINGDSATASLTYMPTVAGPYTLSLRATDRNGLVSVVNTAVDTAIEVPPIGSFTLETNPSTITVFASLFLNSFSTPTKIKVVPAGLYNGNVQLSLVSVTPTFPVGFLSLYTPDSIVGLGEYNESTSFKVRVLTSNADPLLHKTFTVRLRGVDTAYSSISDEVDITLIIRASDPGGGEQ